MEAKLEPGSAVGRPQRYVAWLLRHRWLVFALSCVALLGAGYRTVLTYSNLRSEIEELLPESAPSVAALNTARSRLPGLRHLGIVIDTGGAQNVSVANKLADQLAERIRRYPPELVRAVRTGVAEERAFGETYALQLMDPADVRLLRESVEKRRDWDVTRAMGLELDDDEQPAPAPEVPIQQLIDKYKARYGGVKPFPDDRFVSADGRTVVVLVQTSALQSSFGADKELVERIKADLHELGLPKLAGGAMRVGFAGDVATRVEETEGLAADLGLSGVLVLLLVIASIIWFYGSWQSVPALSIPLIFGTCFAFGLAALPPLSIRYLNSNTAFLASIIVGNGINSGIIVLARFMEERRAGHDVERAIAIAVAETWQPTLAAASAASAAYGSLVFTDFRGFNQFGWIGGIGMLTSWACMFVLLPIVTYWFGESLTRGQMRTKPGIGTRLTVALLRRPRAVLAITLVAVVGSVVGVAKRSGDWVEYDLSKLRRRDSWVVGERFWGQRMDATLGRYLTPTVIMTSGHEQAVAVRDRVAQLKLDNKAGDLIAAVRTIDDVVPQTRFAALEEARRLRDVLTPKLKSELKPRERDLVERALSDQALVPLTPAQVPAVLVAGLLERDGRADRNVLVFPKLSAGTWDAQRIAVYASDLRSAAGGAPVTGSLLISSDIADAMQADGPRATGVALLVVLAICVLTFRSLGMSVAAVASLFAGVLLMLGLMAWTGSRLNFSNFVALPITFGIGADYSINMLKRFQSEPGDSLGAALANTGGAVALCSITTIIGFGSLLVAQNRALFSFGVFAVAGEIACLTTAVLTLPATLEWVARRRRRAALTSRV